MALTERSRSAIYQGLSAIIEDEEAVGEMLSYFPARDVEEPASKELVRSESALTRADLRSEMAELRAELHGEMAELRAELHGEMAELRAEWHGEMAELKDQLHTDIQRVIGWMVGSMLTLTALLVAITGLVR